MCRYNPRHPGHLGGDDTHVGRRHHRVTPARDIAADAVDRDIAVSQGHSRQGLDLDVAQRVFLYLREISDLRLGELNVVDGLLGQGIDQFLYLCLAEAEALRRPFVKLFR